MFMENDDFEGKEASGGVNYTQRRSLQMHDTDDLLSPRPDSATSLGSAGNLSTFENRKQVLMQQRQRVRDRQQKRRFTGASRPISAARQGSMSNFSAPKAIDPLEGEDVLPASSIRQTGYADTYKGGFDPNMNNAAIPNGRPSRTESVESKSSENMHDESLQRHTKNEKRHNEAPQRRSPYGGPRENFYRDEVPIPNATQSDTSHRNEQQQYDNYYDGYSKHNLNNAPETLGEYQPKQTQRNRHQPSETKQAERAPMDNRRRPSAGQTNHGTHTRQSYNDNHRGSDDFQHDGFQEYDHQPEHQQQNRNIQNPYNKSQRFSHQEQHRQMKNDQPQRLKAESKPEPRRQKGAKPSAQPNTMESKVQEKRDILEESKSLEKDVTQLAIDSTFTPNDEPDDDDLADELELDQDEETVPTQALNLTDMKKFLMEPTPKAAGVVQCYIERNKNGSKKMFPEYHLFMKDGDRFLMASKKRAKNRTSNYIISMNQHDLSRDSPSFVGKLRSNFLGTEFTIYDKGVNPKQCDPDSLMASNGMVRQELGVVTYASNVLGSRGPRKMKVAVPQVSTEGVRHPWRPVKQSEQMLTRFKDKDLSKLTKLSNKPPRWNESVSAYVLNFNGRVTMASVKNFQLVTQEDQESIVLQFGRVGKDLFTMDYQFPLSPFQAFAICLSSFDSKLACE